MQPEFWRQRWQEGRIGFHREDINPALLRFWPSLGLPAAAPVLVPLCGKSRDMAWLAQQGHAVIGVELVGAAIAAFFAAENLDPTQERAGAVTIHRAGPYRLIEGDWFAVEPEHIGPITAVYDRAALIALPPDLRRRYATNLDRLAPNATQLLVCLEYPDGEIPGPPFSIDSAAVAACYAETRIHRLNRQDLPLDAGPPGLTRLGEAVYRIEPTSV